MERSDRTKQGIMEDRNPV